MRDQLWTAEELAEVSEEFETAPPSSVIRWAAENFGERFIVNRAGQDGVVGLIAVAQIGDDFLVRSFFAFFPHPHADLPCNVRE